MRVRLAGWCTALAVVAAAGLARANDFDQFQNARVAYESQHHELAADLFRGLLRDATPRDRRPLILESRKYLAATLLFLGKTREAEQQLELLLEAEPDYALDPLAFPAEFGKTFAAVRLRLEKKHELEAEQRARKAAEQRSQAALDDKRKRERMKRLYELAGTERVERLRSRWIALLPFGIGQFQNDHDNLGLLLAISQGALLSTGIISYAVHESLRDEHPTTPSVVADAELAEGASRYVNQISLGLFAAVAVTGIIDAQVRFQPSRSFDRPRPLPPDLRALDLSVGPGAILLRGHF
jgi:hypothetical protein